MAMARILDRVAADGIGLLLFIGEKTLARRRNSLGEAFEGIAFKCHVARIDQSDCRRRLFDTPFEDETVIADNSAVSVPEHERAIICCRLFLAMNNDGVIFDNASKTEQGDGVTAVDFDHAVS